MWIFCGGMHRSGSTLQFQLTAHLVEAAGRGRRVEWAPADEFPRVREASRGEPGWKVFKTHHCTPAVAAEFAARNARGVYIFRDVRDVVVSRVRISGRSFDAVWARALDRALAAFDQWTRLADVLVSRYETVVGDVAAEVARIATHLALDVDRRECERIAAAYAPARQEERIREAVAAGRLRPGPGGRLFDPVSNLHVNHIGSGRSGDWRTALSAEELALVEGRARRWLTANGYPLALGRWRRALLARRYVWRHHPRPRRRPDGRPDP